MSEKLRLGTPVVILLAFDESFCAAMDGTIVQKASKIGIILIHITDARRGDCIVLGPGFCGSLPGLEWRRLVSISTLGGVAL
jgi:hypothetical protein